MRKSGRCSHAALCAPLRSAGSLRGAYVCRNANPLSQDPDSGRHQRSESFREKLNSFRTLLLRMCPGSGVFAGCSLITWLETLSGPFLIDLGFERLHYFINSGDRPTAVLNVREHFAVLRAPAPSSLHACGPVDTERVGAIPAQAPHRHHGPIRCWQDDPAEGALPPSPRGV